MLAVYQEVENKKNELEELRVLAQVNEITYRQKGEIDIADRFKVLEDALHKAVRVLKDGIKED